MFQLHLSTLIGVSLLGAVLLGVNTVQRKAVYVHVSSHAVADWAPVVVGRTRYIPHAGGLVVRILVCETGWPFKVRAEHTISGNGKPYALAPEGSIYETIRGEFIRLSVFKGAFKAGYVPYDDFVRLAPEVKKAYDEWTWDPYPTDASVWTGAIPYPIVLGNAAIALVLLFVAAVGLEYFHRRLKQRDGAG